MKIIIQNIVSNQMRVCNSNIACLQFKYYVFAIQISRVCQIYRIKFDSKSYYVSKICSNDCNFAIQKSNIEFFEFAKNEFCDIFAQCDLISNFFKIRFCCLQYFVIVFIIIQCAHNRFSILLND